MKKPSFNHQGFALINALALAKVMLVGEYLHVGTILRIDRSFTQSYSSLLFLPCSWFASILSKNPLSESCVARRFLKASPASARNTGGIVGVGIIMFVVLMPFFAFRELDRVIGQKNYALSYCGDETKISAASPILRRRCERLPPLSPFSRSGAVGSPVTPSEHNSALRHAKGRTWFHVHTVTASGIVVPGDGPVVARVSGVIRRLSATLR